MKKDEINDIEVTEVTNVTMESITKDALSSIENARSLLKSYGYYVDNLWHIDDIVFRYECTDKDAQDVLDNALTSDRMFNETWESIARTAEDMNFKEIV